MKSNNSKIAVLIVGILFIANTSFAESQDLSSTSSYTYEIEDGYGKYKGFGKDKIEASSNAREACIMQKVVAYESRHGYTPDEDTVDLFFDACINK